jgi:hypothetical protein
MTYNMTGTVTSASGSNAAVAVGDHVTWTLQYNPATPVISTTSFGHFYSPNGPVLSHLVDQTKGIQLYTPTSANLRAGLMLSNLPMMGSSFYAGDTQRVSGTPDPMNLVYQTQLFLGHGNSLTSLDLTKFRPDRAGFVWAGQGGTTNELTYFDNHLPDNGRYSLLFTAAVDSLSVSAVPEPGSFTLFLLGAIGLAARSLLPRSGACPRSPSPATDRTGTCFGHPGQRDRRPHSVAGMGRLCEA